MFVNSVIHMLLTDRWVLPLAVAAFVFVALLAVLA